MKRIVWIGIAAFFVAFSCIDTVPFLNNMKYSELVNFFKADNSSDLDSFCQDKKINGTDCEFIGKMLIGLKYIAFSSLAMLAIAFMYEKTKILCKKYDKVNNYEYELLGSSHEIIYSNKYLTFIHYLLAFVCIILWIAVMIKIQKYIPANFSAGIIIMIVGNVMIIMNFFSLFLCQNRIGNTYDTDV